jgi:hypothetical protein
MFEGNSNHADENEDLRHGCDTVAALGQAFHGD